MKAWLSDILLLTLKRLWKGGYERVCKWLFDPQRHARIRFANRELWWKLKKKAEQTKDPYDDMAAEANRIEFAFKTPPEAAICRGDLDPEIRTIAIDAMERARIAAKHGDHP